MAQSVGEVALDIVAGKNTVGDAINDAMNDAQRVANRGSSRIGNALGKIGGIAKTVGKVTAVGLGAAGTAFVGLGKHAVDAYANYEQLVGGVETLFGESADIVIANADRAYKTAGMSANEYMETVTSFSASLLQSLGGDTVKASEMADMAITDMSDNANKMGTSMEMIQNAYNGFAKQNYTMLDNLKLGYGGTKSEMERLLADAQAISGIEYDISSYADIVDAIHVVQTEMGITGTTAKEAEGTISGSLAMVKASWENVLTGMTSDDADFGALIDELVDSISVAGENLIPRISKVLEGATNLVTQLAPKIIAMIPGILAELLPELINGAVALVRAIIDFVPQLVDLLIQTLPQFIEGFQSIFEGIIQALPDLITSLVSALPTLIPMLVDGLVSLITTLIGSFSDIIQPIIDYLPDIIIAVVDAIMNNLPVLIDGLIQLTLAIVGALPEIIMALVEAMPTVISSIVQGLIASAPILLEGFTQIFGGAWDIISTIFSPVIDFFGGLFRGAVNVVSTVFSAILNVLGNIWNGIKIVFAPVIGFFSGIFRGVVNAIKAVFTPIVQFFSSIFTLAVNVIRTVFSAVTQIFSSIWNTVKNIFAGVVSFFSGIFNGAVNIIRNVFNPIVEFFSGIWKSITGIFSKVGEVIGNAITNVVSKAVNAVLSTAVSIINGFITAINFAIGLINAIPGVSINKLDKLEVPQMAKGGVLERGQVGLLEGNGAEAVVPLEKNTGWLTRVADMLGERMAGRNALITPPALENVRAGSKTDNTANNQSKIDELIELIKKLLDKDDPTTVPIYIGNELIEEYILNKTNRQTLRSGGRA